ncbi:MAG: hypothetical protein ABIP78_09775 [Pyrinomonadaceae bacterium]
MSDNETDLKDRMTQKLKYWGTIAGIVIAAFLIGLVPMWLNARNNAAERDAARTELRKSEIVNLLSASIVDARRGEYETARQEASDFFTRLRNEDEKGDLGFLTADQRSKIKPIFVERDATITMLAQRDPAALDRLTNVYVSFTQTVSKMTNTVSPSPGSTAR